jgi:hypothetical protein
MMNETPGPPRPTGKALQKTSMVLLSCAWLLWSHERTIGFVERNEWSIRSTWPAQDDWYWEIGQGVPVSRL